MKKIVLLIVILLVVPVVFAHTVSMNFRFHIYDKNDITHINNATYVSSEHDNTLASLIFGGSALIRASLDSSTDPYLFQIAQDEAQNKFLLVLTSGTWQNIERAHGIPSQTFGNLPAPANITKGLAIQLQFDTIDIIGLLAPGQLLIKSLGRLRVPIVSLGIM